MDSADPQGSPGVNHEDGVVGPILTSVEAGTDLDNWASTSVLPDEQKDVSTASRLLFLTVEYVEENESEYGRSAFAGFEPGTPFSPQQPASLSEFEHRVSPLDPNMGSTAHYSPVYTINGNSDSLNVSPEISSSNTTVTSNPSSPFQSQVVILNPSSPLITSTPGTLPSPHFRETSHGHSSTASAVTNAKITQGFVNHILSNSVASPVACAPSSSDAGGELLGRVVNDENYFHHSSNTVLTGDLNGSPLNSNSPHSPIQAPLTPADNYVVSSSTETLDAMGPRPTDYHSNATVGDANSPNVVDSTSEMLIHSSTMQQTTEISGATDTSFHNLDPAGVLTSSNVQLKHDALDRVQLLISSSDGSIAYSLDGQASFYTRIVDMGNEIHSHCTTDDHLNSVINSFKMQGLVLGQGENGDLQLRPPQTDEIHSDEKLSGTLGLRELTFAMRQQQNELLQQTLLNTPLNGDLTESVARLSESLLNDVKISIVDSSLEAVAPYNDILMEAACVGGVIGTEISNDALAQASPEICTDFDPPNLGKYKERLQGFSSTAITSPTEESLPPKTLSPVDISSSCSSECSESHFQTAESLSLASSSLPAVYLAIGKLPIKKSEEICYGVFARKTIPKGTQFGPIEGVYISAMEFLCQPGPKKFSENLVFLIETESGEIKKLDLSRENTPNWMRFIRTASCFKEQNVILCQQGKSLFFITSRTIQPRQELRVWYSLSYAKKHGLPFLQPVKFNIQDNEDSSNNWSCFKCHENFSNSVELQCHLNTHEFDTIKLRDSNKLEQSESKVQQRYTLNKHSERNKLHFLQSQTCVFHCRYCNHTFIRNCSIKKSHDFNLKARKYLCEVCGHQFLHVHNSDCQIKWKNKILGPDCAKQLLILPKKNVINHDAENGKKRNKTEWYCNHCNLNFDNPSICNLHTLAHAAENVKETEGNYTQEFQRPSHCIDSKDLRCPKCTKRVESSDITLQTNGIGKEISQSCEGNVQFNSLTQESILLDSNNTNIPYNLSEKSNFIGGRVMDIDESHFLPSSPCEPCEEDNQLNSVLNSFKIEDDKLSGSLDLQDLALSVRQPQHDLLEQTMLGAPLNGDLTESVRFNQYDDVKISIVDPSLEEVGAYSDILIQSACVENVVGNEMSNNINTEAAQICSDFVHSTGKCHIKVLSSESNASDNGTKFVSSKLSEIKQKLLKRHNKKSFIAHTLASLHSNYFSIKKILRKSKKLDYGVFACKTIPCRTRIGPIKGTLVDTIDFSKDLENAKKSLFLLIETEVGKVMKLDISKKKAFTWVKFIRVAPSFRQQNLILSQQGQSLFFTTTKVIHHRQELRVWYSMQYARRHGLPLLQPEKINVTVPHILPSIWQCFKCEVHFVTPEALQFHLNTHEMAKSSECRDIDQQPLSPLRKPRCEKVSTEWYS